ncbi:hypothetical protein GYH30_000658 [Glycine max]|nr:hypothetical protein GYH30_000658 [Glycine max]
MPTVLSVTMAIGSHRLSQQGAITKRMTSIEEMAGMDVLCNDKTGTLTLNKLTVDKNLVEARAGIQEVHFLPFNPSDKWTTLTYLDQDGKMHRVSKGVPEQILNLAHNKENIERRVHSVIKFAERGLRSLVVAYQEVPDGRKESAGGPWQFIGLLSLFDPPRHDRAETIRRALNLGVNVKMIIAVAPALKKADIGIAVVDATDAARSASDIVLTEPGLSVIISVVLTSRAIFQRMKNYIVS